MIDRMGTPVAMVGDAGVLRKGPRSALVLLAVLAGSSFKYHRVHSFTPRRSNSVRRTDRDKRGFIRRETALKGFEIWGGKSP